MILYELGDGIKGERIRCEYRKSTKPILIARGAHSYQRIIIHGLPAGCWIEKPIRVSK